MLSDEKNIARIIIIMASIAAVMTLNNTTVLAEDFACNICNEGCVQDSSCAGDTPYLCKKSWNIDTCVAKGYDGGCCGGKTDKLGYCFECSGGCVSQADLGGRCGLFTVCGADEYCCKRSEWYASNVCKPKYADMGCCGGPPSSGDRITYLKATITNNKAVCTSMLKWEVRAKGSATFTDYSSDCVEGRPSSGIKIDSKQSMSFTCTSQELPSAKTGPHTARVSWCGQSGEYEYNLVSGTCAYEGGTCGAWTVCPPESPREIPKNLITDCADSGKLCCTSGAVISDTFVTLKYPEGDGAPLLKSLKLTCKAEVLGTIKTTPIDAEYDSTTIAGGEQLVRFKFTRAGLQQIKDAGCTW